ncbi:MAG: ATPase, T2SS/T4P/T4SS family [Pseudomonadota bacterium]
MNADFEWPTPPHFDLASKPTHGTPEPGLIVMNDSRRLIGSIVRFDAAAAVLEFQIERATTNLSISLASIKSVRLTRPIELKRFFLPGAQQGAEVFPTSEKQKCYVRFKDGDDLESETMGYIVDKAGLFLFLTYHSDKVLRWFIPMEGVATYDIGDQLGKLLIDENVPREAIDAGLEKQQQLRSQKLGDYLTKEHIVSQDQLEIALQSQKAAPQLKLGEALILENLLSEKELEDALLMQSKDRKLRLGEILINMGFVNQAMITRVLVQKLGIPFVDLNKFDFGAEVFKLVPANVAVKNSVVPLYATDTRMVVAMENPLAWDSLKELEFYTKLKIDPVLAAPEDLAHTIERLYGVQEAKGEEMSDLVSALENSQEPAESETDDAVTESDSALVRLVNKIILDAYKQGVSDIHIESLPGNKPSKVRFRKDGAMKTYSEVPPNFRAALISRIKIMTRLDISEKRHSQDGKMNFAQFGPAKIELRVVTVPTANGLEDIVMRILAAPKAVSIEGLGVSARVLEDLKRLTIKPYGLLFVCGPTGSGKTTTLHALLGHINTPERKIWTAEDPVEITQEGMRQVQVQAKIGWTFAAVLRTFLRADPDVIMVGETRDQETAKTVIEASLTGHLVFSTMHTNSAPESVVRLLDFGLDPFNFADALLGVVAQRLARRLCPACRKPYIASDEELGNLAHEYCWNTDYIASEVLDRWRTQYGDKDGAITLFSAGSCEKCDKLGYKGRLGVHELLVASPAVKRKILAKANVSELSKTAMSEGMQTLRQDGIEKILQGHTDLEHIQAVCL